MIALRKAAAAAAYNAFIPAGQGRGFADATLCRTGSIVCRYGQPDFAF
jgi:hypothetical protein